MSWEIGQYMYLQEKKEELLRNIESRVSRHLGPATHALCEVASSNPEPTLIAYTETATGPCDNDTRAALADDTLRSAGSHAVSARVPRTSTSLRLLTFG
jgi:hypothetical protein